MADSSRSVPAPSPIRWPRTICVLGLLLLGVEFASRLMVQAWAGHPYASFAPYRWSPYGLVRNNPDLTSPAFHISGNGFRSVRTYSPRKPERTLRVMLMGGSVLYSGLGRFVIPGVERVDSAHTIAQFLEERLKQDPAFAGLNVEVINAGVNYNRIVEISSAYLAEYIHWSPDFVIVCGSANNFGYAPTSSQLRGRHYSIQSPHPWAMEFERLVNSTETSAVIERMLRGAESKSAFVALVRKAASKGVDVAVDRSQSVASARAPRVAQSAAPAADALATPSEYDGYVQEYLGYAAAMSAAAHERQQDISFFWEYYIAHLKGIKPFSDVEKLLYEKNRVYALEQDFEYDTRARTRVREFCAARNQLFIDPLPALSKSSETVYIDYLHYTKEGNRFMADVMYEQLKSRLHEKAQAIASAR